MTPIRIVRADDVEWNTYGGGELAGMRHPGDAEHPQCFEMVCPPNYEGRLHAHEANEIIYVVEGELRMGDETLAAGASVFIPARTLYRLDAGPDGARYVNFRPTLDTTLLTEADAG